MDSEEWNRKDDSLPAFYSFFLHNYNNSSQNVTTDETLINHSTDYPLETLANRESLSEIKTIDSLNTEHNKVNDIRKNFFWSAGRGKVKESSPAKPLQKCQNEVYSNFNCLLYLTTSIVVFSRMNLQALIVFFDNFFSGS
jgi:hypothetical protein